MKIRVFCVSLLLALAVMQTGQSVVLGPAEDYPGLLSLAQQAQNGDIVTIRGLIDASSGIPLSTSSWITLTSGDASPSVIYGLNVSNASVTMSNVHLADSLFIDGNSDVELQNNVSIQGSRFNSALTFSGSGQLIIDPSCHIIGEEGAAGVTISQTSGAFYGALEGEITGGRGSTGGAGVIISPLRENGILLISGQVAGGSGSDMGGNGANLYGIASNAYISIAGMLSGGAGEVGGDGIQIISPGDNTIIGVNATVSGGQGNSYGGNGIILMNANGASSISLSGHFMGGDTTAPQSEPGQSVLLVGDSYLHTNIGDCLLLDGSSRYVSPVEETPVPTATPVPLLTEVPATVPVEEPAVLPDPAVLPEETAAPTEGNPAETVPVEIPQETAAPEETAPPAETMPPAEEPPVENEETTPPEPNPEKLPSEDSDPETSAESPD